MRKEGGPVQWVSSLDTNTTAAAAFQQMAGQRGGARLGQLNVVRRHLGPAARRPFLLRIRRLLAEEELPIWPRVRRWVYSRKKRSL